MDEFITNLLIMLPVYGAGFVIFTIIEVIQ